MCCTIGAHRRYKDGVKAIQLIKGIFESIEIWTGCFFYIVRKNYVEGGCHWPKCEIFETNYTTKQHYNRVLKVIRDTMEPHAFECVEFAKALVGEAPSPVPAEESLQVITILDGIYRSQKAGREVKL